MVENFTYAKVVDHFYWGVKVDDLSLGNTSLDIYATDTMDLVSVIDTGTSLIYIDKGTYRKMLAEFKALGITCKLNHRFYYCKAKKDKFPPFKATIAGKQMEIPGEDYLFYAGEPDTYYILIVPINIGGYFKRLALFGDIFMRRYYTIFNEDDMTIGFAKAQLDRKIIEETAELTIIKDDDDWYIHLSRKLVALTLVFISIAIVYYYGGSTKPNSSD